MDRVVCREDVSPDIPLVNRISWEREGSLIPPFLEHPLPCLLISRKDLTDKCMYTHFLFIPCFEGFIPLLAEGCPSGYHRNGLGVDPSHPPAPISHFHLLPTGRFSYKPSREGILITVHKTSVIFPEPSHPTSRNQP